MYGLKLFFIFFMIRGKKQIFIKIRLKKMILIVVEICYKSKIHCMIRQ